MGESVDIREVAKVIRSKNAGPFRLTLDILFKSTDVYERVRDSGIITTELIAGLYGMRADQVTNFVWFDPGKALKMTLVRPRSSAAIGDTDVYAAQQHAPLLQLKFPRELVGQSSL